MCLQRSSERIEGETRPPKPGWKVIPQSKDATWYGGRPRPWRYCARWGPSSPPPKENNPQFSAHVCCGQTRLPVFKKGAHSQFLAHVYCSQTAGWIKMPLSTTVSLGPGHIVLHGTQVLPLKGTQPPIFGPCLLWPNGRPSQLLLSTCQLLRPSGALDALYPLEA